MQQYPSIFIVETVLGCNLSCPECAIGGKYINRKYGMLPFEQFVHIADKIRNHCKYLYLHSWGEPMLNPDILKMIGYAKKFTRTNISTNANMLTEESAKILVDSGVTDIIVSIDGVSQECYSIYRRGGDVKRALDALRWLAKHAGYSPAGSFRSWLRTFRLMKSVKTNIIPQFIVFKHNEDEMQSFAEYCTGLGLVPSFKSPYLKANSTLSLGSDSKYHRTIFSSDEKTRKHNMKKCMDMMDAFTILLDGSIVPCCYDHNAKVVFGNIFEQSVEATVASPVYTSFQKSLAMGNAPEFCLENCLAY